MKETVAIRISMLTHLQKLLDGKCSRDKHTCPKMIIKTHFTFNTVRVQDIWDCIHCEYHFQFLRGKDKLVNMCPCSSGVNPDIILYRLEEVIKELKGEE